MSEKTLKLVTISQILGKLEISKTFFYDKIVKMQDFPAAVPLAGCVRYIEADLDDWLRAQLKNAQISVSANCNHSKLEQHVVSQSTAEFTNQATVHNSTICSNNHSLLSVDDAEVV